jgi:hypothetical protein
MIVSRKRTHNLFDLTTLWKKLVLSNMEQQILPDNHDLISQNIDISNDDMDIDDQDDSSSSDEMKIHLSRCSGTKAPSSK